MDRRQSKALGIVYRTIATRLINKAGFQCQDAASGAATLIKRFGSVLNVNLHSHQRVIDGVYYTNHHGTQGFRCVKAPDRSELEGLVQRISRRVGRCLERQGLLVRIARTPGSTWRHQRKTM